MKSRWTIKKCYTKAGRLRFEPWYDGKYLGRFDTHEEAWDVISKKRVDMLSDPTNDAIVKDQIEKSAAARLAQQKQRKESRKTLFLPREANVTYGIGTTSPLDVYRKLAETA